MRLDIGGEKGRNDIRGRWKTVDIIPSADFVVDISHERLPFENDSVDAIYTSHTMEHIPPRNVLYAFKEMHRVLKPGNPIRVVVPDVDRAINAYVSGNKKYLSDWRNPGYDKDLPDMPIHRLMAWFCSLPNGELKGGHVMAYTRNSLDRWLTMAGFINVVESSFSPKMPAFEGKDVKRYRDCSIYMNGIKPVSK